MMTRARRTAMVALAVLALGAAPWAGGARPGDTVEDLLLDLQVIPLDGQLPPPFTLEGLDGKRASLSDFRGQVVVLYFWASW